MARRADMTTIGFYTTARRLRAEQSLDKRDLSLHQRFTGLWNGLQILQVTCKTDPSITAARYEEHKFGGGKFHGTPDILPAYVILLRHFKNNYGPDAERPHADYKIIEAQLLTPREPATVVPEYEIESPGVNESTLAARIAKLEDRALVGAHMLGLTLDLSLLPQTKARD